jgi:hypothetical protein
MKISHTVWKRCTWCGIEVKAYMSHKRFANSYCSLKCYGKSKAGRPVLSPTQYAELGAKQTGINNPGWKGGEEHNKLVSAEWVSRNREKKNQHNALRRALRRNAEGSFTLDEWEDLKRANGYKCLSCGGEEPSVRLTRDHIIPLSKGGTNFISNIQPLCLSCNSRKYNKIFPDQRECA